MTKSIPRDQRATSLRASWGCALASSALVLAATARAEEPRPHGVAPGGGAPASSPADPREDHELPEFVKTVGGHVGIATPLVTVASNTTSIADQFTLLNPIGIGFHVSEDWIVDFETIVANPIHPTGTTGLVVDPGIIHSFGRVAVGLRVAFQINHDANVGLVPLANVGLVDLGGATWFVEAAFPTFYYGQKGELNVVLHTGIGF